MARTPPNQQNVIFPILFFLGIFVVMLVLFAPRSTRIPTETPTQVAQVAVQPMPQPTPSDHLTLMMSGLETVLASDVRAGQRLYGSACSACHGINAQGISGLGKGMINNSFINSLNDDELVAFISVGRTTRDPMNTTGVAMPAKGGNPSLTDKNLHDIVDYIRSLNGATIIDDMADRPPVVYELREFVPIDLSALDGVVINPSAGASGTLELTALSGEQAYIWACAECHGIDGSGTLLIPNSSLVGMTIDQDALFAMFTNEQPIAYSETYLHAVRGGYPALDDDQLQALVAYVNTLAGQ